MNGTTTETWEHLEALARRHGPSFHLADPDRFEANCRRLLDVFHERYPRTALAYSYKTNYLPAFALRADALGAYAEVVSAFEFEYARRLGVPGDRIVFNGPIKQVADARRALTAGAIVNVDSVSELRALARDGGRDVSTRVGIRCDLGLLTPNSRFGIDLDHPEGREALATLDAAPGLRLAGLHCHYSGDRNASRYRERTRALVDLHQRVLGGRPLDFLDIGGGFAGRMPPELASQLESSAASYEDYAEAVAGEMASAYGPGGPELIVEPGMALLADAMTFATRVETVKTQHRRLAVVDGSALHIQPPWNLLRKSINLPVRVAAAPEGAPARWDGPWDLVGDTCIEGDLLHEGYEGPLGIGDYVLFDNVGAYTNVLNAPFIRGTPPIVTAAGDLLRPASTVDDLLRSYAVEVR